jgi:hypothetical protein
MTPLEEKVMVPAYSYGLEGGVSGIVEQGFDAVGTGCEWLTYISGR